jgi:hypothetical protein
MPLASGPPFCENAWRCALTLDLEKFDRFSPGGFGTFLQGKAPRILEAGFQQVAAPAAATLAVAVPIFCSRSAVGDYFSVGPIAMATRGRGGVL